MGLVPKLGKFFWTKFKKKYKKLDRIYRMIRIFLLD